MGDAMSSQHRNNPDSEECQRMDRENRQAVFAAQMQAKQDERLANGTGVWTETMSGEPLHCTIIRFFDGEYELDSPTHGYVIRRSREEIEPA